MIIMIKINGEEIKVSYFPDKTMAVRYEPAINPDYIGNIDVDRCQFEDSDFVIEWYYENDEEMVRLYYLVSHLRQAAGVKDIILYLPYIPNARMDRVKNSDEIFTLKYFAGFINGLTFKKVIVRDAHSNVSLALIDNVVCEDISPKAKELADRLLGENDIVFFPDEGAGKRYSDMFGRRYAFGIKKRDWRTGEIIGLDVAGDMPEGKFNVLIVDDICSYGGTFYHSALKLKELGADKIWLYVTHCENNIINGKIPDSGLIEKVFTTRSIFNVDSDFVEII